MFRTAVHVLHIQEVLAGSELLIEWWLYSDAMSAVVTWLRFSRSLSCVDTKLPKVRILGDQWTICITYLLSLFLMILLYASISWPNVLSRMETYIHEWLVPTWAVCILDLIDIKICSSSGPSILLRAALVQRNDPLNQQSTVMVPVCYLSIWGIS